MGRDPRGHGSDKVTLSGRIPGSTAGALPGAAHPPDGGKTPPNPAGVSLECRRGGLAKRFLGEKETACVTHRRFESAAPKPLRVLPLPLPWVCSNSPFY